MTSILVVDDEEDLRDLLVSRLKRKNYQAEAAESAEKALALLAEKSFDLGIFDIRMEEKDGLTLLEEVKNGLLPAMEVIMLTGHGTIESAIDAMKKGAYDYITKPYNLSELEMTIEKALEKKRLIDRNETMKAWMHSRENNFDMIGSSSKIQAVKTLTAKVADARASIMIEGESGTGKELVAKALHYWSDRADEPFIAVNAGAIPEQLLESELFGHAKGAFTGAQKEKKGLVEAADAGTLFLDEIGEMPLETQAKWLRFLETGQYRRVGEVQERSVNVRVVAATNRDMADQVAKGEFREDLYYRLQVLTIEVPPLRERKEDIPELCEHYLRTVKKRPDLSLSQDAARALQSYDFPGNIRELFHFLERGVLLASAKTIETEDLMLPGLQGKEGSAKDGAEQKQTLEEIEAFHIKNVLDETGWNKSEAAEILGISVRNIYRKIDHHGLES
ncbi:sigma-54-dependent transcriptional regulator [Salisediminibacterium halotolerans]|uniref:Two-component system, NtrC family, response regulator/two-component system, NtrC family, response regulator AtoC n=1 Tax=Salisediminibacterium halotolerans TaxID=517425 RepID=A0A1H9TBN8_9BACI|nr:sigma-54 dependent transcriptional regulator [Salisediminibacterium haloalkalitolerans]SER94632.1 two-component system, NtrC family, response regulator/two-component system, NtrC family, response regulator AtoC [Salisediminibacterium haloalkalitolerans]